MMRSKTLEECPWMREQQLQRLPCEEGLCSKKKKEDSLAKMWCKGEMAGKEAGRDQMMDRLEARAKEARFQSQ